MQVFKADQLRNISIRLLEKMKVPYDIAQVVSNNIVENCLYGHDTHGMVLLPRFIKDIETGKINPKAKTKIVKKSKGVVCINGNRGFGQLTMINSMNTAIEIAKEIGISAVTVTDCNHIGILWTFAKMPTDNGMIGMIWCASGPQGGLVAPYGGIKRAIGANPMAIGIPAGRMKPLILDMSTSVVAGGKITLHAQQNKKIPFGWMLDEHGNPTADPKKLFKKGRIGGELAGVLLPMAGYKGFGLGMVIELLGGVLTGYGLAYTPNYKEGNGVFIIVIDVKKFIPLDEFSKETDRLFKHIKSIPTDSKTKEILIPGELEFRTRKQRENDGIPVTDTVWLDITTIADKLKVNLE